MRIDNNFDILDTLLQILGSLLMIILFSATIYYNPDSNTLSLKILNIIFNTIILLCNSYLLWEEFNYLKLNDSTLITEVMLYFSWRILMVMNVCWVVYHII